MQAPRGCLQFLKLRKVAKIKKKTASQNFFNKKEIFILIFGKTP